MYYYHKILKIGVMAVIAVAVFGWIYLHLTAPETGRAETVYQGKADQLYEAKKAFCIAERDLAKAKVTDYHTGKRDLAVGEDILALTTKAEKSCEEPSGNVARAETGNFTPVETGGIEAFLQKNAADFVKDKAEVFREAGKKYGIKPEVLVCIAQADSSLGRALKTANNIGNVSNNDRGNTRSFPTVEAGIEAIAQTLNNGYLGSYTTIGQLSRGGGNTHGKIYASSPYNWNKNMKLCLRNILQDQSLNESFNFRT